MEIIFTSYPEQAKNLRSQIWFMSKIFLQTHESFAIAWELSELEARSSVSFIY